MQFTYFTDQDYLESGLLLIGDINDIASLACHKTRDFRIDEYIPIDPIDGKDIVSIDPEHEMRIKKHTERIQRAIRRQSSSAAG